MERKPNPTFDFYAFRKRMGMTQRAMARKLQVTTMTLIRWERYGVPVPEWRIRRFKEMEEEKALGQHPERATAPSPTVQREFPEPSARTGKAESIGVAPGSF